jgi:hypothetical protein
MKDAGQYTVYQKKHGLELYTVYQKKHGLELEQKFLKRGKMIRKIQGHKKT